MSRLVLAFDTALAACSACLSRDGNALAHRLEYLQRGQSEALVPMIAEVLSQAGAVIDDVDLIATTVGPGTFTGLRIGLATALGLGLATGKPVLGLTTLEVVASAQRRADPFVVALETKRSDFYVQMFHEPNSALAAPSALEADAILEALGTTTPPLAGDAADRLATALADRGCRLARLDGPPLPDARIIAALAARRGVEYSTFKPGKAPQPLYLRAPDVTIPRDR